jgi:hypothetical protein
MSQHVPDQYRDECERLKIEVERLTAELAEHKGDGKHDHNFTYTAERESLRHENERLRAQLASITFKVEKWANTDDASTFDVLIGFMNDLGITDPRDPESEQP